MASNLTNQVREISNVTKAVAQGNLSRKVHIDARGEMLELKVTVNRMVDQLSMFASEITRVAFEVGTDGILGGQAQVDGVQGTWATLTDNVNVRHLFGLFCSWALIVLSEYGCQSDKPSPRNIGGDQGGSRGPVHPESPR